MAANSEKILELVEIAKNTGKIRKGSNEVTKMLERGKAKLIVIASDTSPPEITMHLPVLAKEKNVPCLTVPSKEDLGAAAGLQVPTTAVAIIDEGDAKTLLKQLSNDE